MSQKFPNYPKECKVKYLDIDYDIHCEFEQVSSVARLQNFCEKSNFAKYLHASYWIKRKISILQSRIAYLKNNGRQDYMKLPEGEF